MISLRKRLYQYRGIIITGLFLVFLFIFFLFVDPTELINFLGVRNSYLVLFFVALVGGTSSFTSSSYYAAIVAFTLSGLHPGLVALIAGTGLFVGDSIFYRIGVWGRDHISGKALRFVEKLSRYVEKKPRWFIQLIIYIYTGFSPFPGDILMISLSFSHFSYKHFIIPGWFGNITLAGIISLAVTLGV